LSQFKKYHPSKNVKFNNLGIFRSLELRILVEKILPISLKLNFTRNTLGCYGLNLKKFLSQGNLAQANKIEKRNSSKLGLNI